MNNRLEDLRELSDLTKKDIAKILGVSDSIYARWENGKDFIPTRRLFQLASYYSVNIDYILYLSNKKLEIHSSKIDMKVCSERAREVRMSSNESYRVFASKLNTAGSTWFAYEKGDALILGAFLVEVCKLYNVSADWLLGRTNKKYL